MYAPTMYRNHCLFCNMFNRYKILLFSNIDERIFSMSSTPHKDENIKVYLYSMLLVFVLTVIG